MLSAAARDWDDAELTRSARRRVTVDATLGGRRATFASLASLSSPAWQASQASLSSWEEEGPTSAVAALGAGEPLGGTPYLVVRRIGQGGMGEIFEAEHAGLGRRAAVKVLHRHHRGRVDLAARMREEARILARLRHPNLVEVFDLGVTADGRPWFAMPLLAGRDLRDELAARGPLPPARAAGLVTQALAGLGAAHEAGLVHRDVKLENLFLEVDGTLKVLDFGIAKLVNAGAGRHTDPDAAPGTPRSMAPEQHAGGAVDARADLYAMGLVLYELVAGRGPFDEVRGSHGLRFAHRQRRPAPPSALSPRPLPPGLDAFVLRALAKRPEDRFQSATEMADALERLVAAPPVAAAVAVAPVVPVALAAPAPPGLRSRGSRRRSRCAGNPWIPATLSALTIAGFALGLVCGRAVPLPSGPPGLDRGGAAASAP